MATDAPQDPESFILTRWCSPQERQVEFLGRYNGRFTASQPGDIKLDEPIDEGAYSDWREVDPIRSEFYRGDQSTDAARELNTLEVERAWSLLRQAQSGPFSESDVVQSDVAFYKNVLAAYQKWFRHFDYEFPIFTPRENPTAGGKNALRAYPYLRLRSDSFAAVARAALGITADSKSELDVAQAVDTFKKPLARENFYPTVPDMGTAERLDVFAERVKAYVERDVDPPAEG